jgi:hypothetical protein
LIRIVPDWAAQSAPPITRNYRLQAD